MEMVQDFRALNQSVVVEFPIVPDPSIILTNVPPDASWFSVIDLFAFTFEGHRYTYTIVPQGYTASLSIFNRILQDDLADIHLPGGSTLLQYMDDILIASPTKEICT